jgi:transketolase
MRSFVNMTVLSIGDPNLVRDAIQASINLPGPLYIRLAQGKQDEVIYQPGSITFEFGKGIVTRDGGDVTLFAHGEMVRQALEAAIALEAEGKSVRVVDMVSIKPIDEELIISCVKETGRVVVLEDHLMTGGLASAVADVMADRGVAPKAFKRLGIPQVFAGFGSGPELRDKYGYGLEATKAALRDILK